MTDRIEFCQNPLPPLVVGLASLGGAIWMAGVWWDANWALCRASQPCEKCGRLLSEDLGKLWRAR